MIPPETCVIGKVLWRKQVLFPQILQVTECLLPKSEPAMLRPDSAERAATLRYQNDSLVHRVKRAVCFKE
jgi:hypothetical protein